MAVGSLIISARNIASLVALVIPIERILNTVPFHCERERKRMKDCYHKTYTKNCFWTYIKDPHRNIVDRIWDRFLRVYQLHSRRIAMIEIVDLDLLHSFVPFELCFHIVFRQFRFDGRIVRFIIIARYPVWFDERLNFMGRIGLLFTRVARPHFGVMSALSLHQLYLVHLVFLAAVHVLRSFRLETTPEQSRLPFV